MLLASVLFYPFLVQPENILIWLHGLALVQPTLTSKHYLQMCAQFSWSPDIVESKSRDRYPILAILSSVWERKRELFLLTV